MTEFSRHLIARSRVIPHQTWEMNSKQWRERERKTAHESERKRVDKRLVRERDRQECENRERKKS